MTVYASCPIDDNNQIIVNAVLLPDQKQMEFVARKHNHPSPQNPNQLEIPHIPVRLVLGTGATCSCICISKMQAFKDLGIEPTDKIPISTPSSGKEKPLRYVYEMGLLIPGAPHMPPHLEFSVRMTETDFSAQGIDGLLGMDILQHCHMSLLGPNKICFLSFHDIPVLQTNRVPPLGVEGDALKQALG